MSWRSVHFELVEAGTKTDSDSESVTKLITATIRGASGGVPWTSAYHQSGVTVGVITVVGSLR